MTALERAKKTGDHKFVTMSETYKKLQAGLITKDQALEILGPSYKNTISMWVMGNCTDKNPEPEALKYAAPSVEAYYRGLLNAD
jgi:hypothetical protein